MNPLALSTGLQGSHRTCCRGPAKAHKLFSIARGRGCAPALVSASQTSCPGHLLTPMEVDNFQAPDFYIHFRRKEHSYLNNKYFFLILRKQYWVTPHRISYPIVWLPLTLESNYSCSLAQERCNDRAIAAKPDDNSLVFYLIWTLNR